MVDDTNAQIKASFNNLIKDSGELEDDSIVLGLKELELYAARVAIEVLGAELEHVQRQLQELYQSKRARIVHVRRDASGSIVQLIGVDGTAA